MFYRVKGLLLYGIVLQGKGSSIVWYMFYRVKRILLYGTVLQGKGSIVVWYCFTG